MKNLFMGMVLGGALLVFAMPAFAERIVLEGSTTVLPIAQIFVHSWNLAITFYYRQETIKVYVNYPIEEILLRVYQKKI